MVLTLFTLIQCHTSPLLKQSMPWPLGSSGSCSCHHYIRPGHCPRRDACAMSTHRLPAPEPRSAGALWGAGVGRARVTGFLHLAQCFRATPTQHARISFLLTAE